MSKSLEQTIIESVSGISESSEYTRTKFRGNRAASRIWDRAMATLGAIEEEGDVEISDYIAFWEAMKKEAGARIKAARDAE